MNEADNAVTESGPPPLSEWIVAAIGLALLCISVAYLGWHAFTARGERPSPAVRVLSVEPQNGHYLVRLKVTNASRATAATLRIEGVLKDGERQVETSETEFQYLPGGSSVQGGMYFVRDPRTLRLEVAAKGFEEP